MIRIENLTKSYGDHKVLSKLNLNVKKGDVYGLVGKNGAGKTTLFKVLLGLSRPDEGKLIINGRSDSAGISEGRARMGFLIGTNFFRYMTGKENIDYYRRLKGIKNADETERVLELVGLKGVKCKYNEYSLGMKQRLGIAAALLGNPEILILDEPINGLDPQGIVDMRQLIKTLNEDMGITIIISSHILSELEHVATRFGIIDKGEILEEFSDMDMEGRSEGYIKINWADAKKALALLSEGDIDVLSLEQSYGSLEKKYFELVGGVDHA